MTKEELEKIRSKFETKYADNITKGLYDSRDLECMRNEDSFLKTYVRNDTPAEDLLHESFKWRNEIKLRDLCEDSFDKWIWDKGAVFFHSKDKDGHRIMNIVVRHHKKDVHVLPSIKKFFAYAVEQAFLEDSTNRIVVMFDMSETGLANLDMELIKYVITCFKYYYPTFLAYMLIYEMPWIFNAAWKVIKAWLSADAVKVIKFVTKSDVQEFINREELLEHMGGLDKFEYKYPIENGSGDRPIENNHSTSLTNRKKVTFADQDSRLYKSISNESISLDTNSNATLKKVSIE
ncbi:motile sperm domain-containing protein 2 [Patella vulgata]|uniref:motile sperm domain-containing protein 2 n=1 Tax=Patella vulgata TaxID=6465 RepID=UPI0024A7B642|nr:motile sperm domain-containing protein 2 [Patella vulgata]